LEMSRANFGNPILVLAYLAITAVMTTVLFNLTAVLLRSRWRLTGRG
jgi:hypothetical protein